MFKSYLKLIRIEHYVKNGLILLPLFFSGYLFDLELLRKVMLGFLAFSFLSSVIYIFNDLKDLEKDRLHTQKQKRPLADGEITVPKALILMVLLFVLFLGLNYLCVEFNLWGWFIPLCYLILNIGYSCGLKNVPIVDIVILVSGFLLRLIYGSVITQIEISKWLCLTVISLSFYMGLGKRRNEVMRENNTRKVLNSYTQNFLDKNMYMCLALTIVFYSFWCIDVDTIKRLGNDNLLWTIPLVMIICLKYSLNIEGNSDGDPIEVIIHDKFLIFLVFVYALIILTLIYGNGFLK